MIGDPVDADEIRNAVRRFLLSEFLTGEDPSNLTDQTPLISSGILDSISTARLVEFLESGYGIRFKSHEVGAERLDTVDRIVDAVETKVGTGGTD